MKNFSALGMDRDCGDVQLCEGCISTYSWRADMKTNRNVLKIVTPFLLMISLPAGAQILGGAANGTLGGTFGGTDIHGAARGAGDAGIDASGPVGSMRDRANTVGGRTREVGAAAASTAGSRVDSTRRTTGATAHTAHSVGADAGRRTVDSAGQARNSAAQSAAAQSSVQPSVQPNGGLLVNGASATATEQRAMGRSVSADSTADWEASGDRSKLTAGAASQTDVSVKKDEPAQ